MPQRFEIKVDIVLNDNKKYFPGDKVQGKILLTSNQSHTLQKLWLAWTGRIQVQPKENEKASHNYFDECWKLCPPIFKSPVKIAKGGSLYNTAFEPFSQPDNSTIEQHPVLLELSKNKTVGFEFEVTVPDIPLPSSTHNGFAAHRIVYFLEAFTGTIDIFYRQKIIPVYERIHVEQPEMMLPQRIDRTYSVMTTENLGCLASMHVIVPCHGHLAGTTIPVSVTIQSDLEISRKQGISVSLLRTHQVIVNDRTFSSFVEPISRSVQDLQLISNNGNATQTAQVMLHIPKDAVPSISIDQSKIMSVSYYIRTLVYAHEGVYVSQDFQESQFLSAEVPFIVGTLKESIPSPPTSPTLSSGKTIDSLLGPTLVSSSSTHTAGSTETSEDNKKLFVGSLFRRTSGKNSGDEKPAKKKNVFTSFWSGRRKQRGEKEDREEEKENIEEIRDIVSSKPSSIQNEENKENELLRIPVVMPVKKPEVMPEFNPKVTQEVTPAVVRHRPFLDSDSEDEVEQLEITKPLEGMRLNKPDEMILQQQIRLEKPHYKDKAM